MIYRLLCRLLGHVPGDWEEMAGHQAYPEYVLQCQRCKLVLKWTPLPPRFPF